MDMCPQMKRARVSAHARALAVVAFTFTACLFVPRAFAQTTGPITSPPTQAAPSKPAKDSSQAAPVGANFAGIWKLNKDQSDDPRKAFQKAAENARGGRHGGWGMRGPGGIGGRGGGRRGGGQEHDQGDGPADMTDFSRLTIDQTDANTKITGATGRILAQSSGDDFESADDGYTSPAAKWKGEQLVVVTKDERRGKTTRAYSLSADAKQLNVVTRVENPRLTQPVTFRLVYDPMKSESSNPSK